MNMRDQLRKAQLYITDEIVRICEKHGIRYFLDCGSMLGAVRHHGFIPWDDDMDIGMPKGDYITFLAVANKELNNDFFLDNYESNPNNALVYTKIRLKGTKYIEEKGNPDSVHNEIFVDIFPYYYISDDKAQRKVEAYIMSAISQALMSKSGYKVWKGESKLKRFKFIPTDILGAIVSKKKMHQWIDYFFNKYSNTSLVCIHAGSCYGYWYFPEKVLIEFIDVKFEDRIYKIPIMYDEYLKVAYGDYMQLPPIEKRTTHLIKELDLGKFHF